VEPTTWVLLEFCPLSIALLTDYHHGRINVIFGRDPIKVDIVSACQLDPPPSATGTKGDKKLGFGKEELGFGDKM
jgi:hypothetical protein